jgi:hypothetical protein
LRIFWVHIEGAFSMTSDTSSSGKGGCKISDWSVDDEDEVVRIRKRYHQGLRAGMSVAEATSYADDRSSSITCAQAESTARPSTVQDSGAMKTNSGESPESVAAPFSPKPMLSVASGNTDHEEKTDTDQLFHDPDRVPSQAPLAQNSNALSEANASSGAENEDPPQQNVLAPGKSTECKVGPDRLPNGRRGSESVICLDPERGGARPPSREHAGRVNQGCERG